MCQFINETTCHKLKRTILINDQKKVSCMSKTKSVRVKIDDAFTLEQEARVLSAELQTVVKVSEIIEELVKDIEVAKARIKTRINGTSS